MPFVVDPSGIAQHAAISNNAYYGWEKAPGSRTARIPFAPPPVKSAEQMGRGAAMLHKAKGAIRSTFTGAAHQKGMKWTRETMGIGQGMLGKALGWGFLGFYAYQGYKENGVLGAAGGIAQGLGESYAAGYAWGAITSSGLGAGMLAGGAIAGGLAAGEIWSQGANIHQFLARPAVHAHMRKRAKLEMAQPIHDQYGNSATMRKRSLMAMRQSKITARGALGMEGSSNYIPYMR